MKKHLEAEASSNTAPKNRHFVSHDPGRSLARIGGFGRRSGLIQNNTQTLHGTSIPTLGWWVWGGHVGHMVKPNIAPDPPKPGDFKQNHRNRCHCRCLGFLRYLGCYGVMIDDTYGYYGVTNLLPLSHDARPYDGVKNEQNLWCPWYGISLRAAAIEQNLRISTGH